MSKYTSHCSACEAVLPDDVERCASHPASGVFMRFVDESHDLVWFCSGCGAQQPDRESKVGQPACVACGKRAGGFQDCPTCRTEKLARGR